MLLLFSEALPDETVKLIIDERILYIRQFLNLITYEGPLSEEDNLQPLRKSPQAKFMRGLMSEVIQTALDYIEKNRKKLHG